LYFYRQHGGKGANERHPWLAAIGTPVHLAAGRPEIDSARVEGVDRHRAAQHADIALALRQPLPERPPFVAPCASSRYPQLTIGRIMFGVAFYGDDVYRFRFVGMYIDDKSKVGGKVAADLAPGFTGIIAAHDVPMLLHEQDVGVGSVEGDAVNAVPHVSVWIGNVFRLQSAVDRLPGLSAIVGAEGARRRDCDEYALGIGGVQKDGMQTHTACPRLPLRSRYVTTKAGKLLPRLSAVGGFEQGRILHTG